MEVLINELSLHKQFNTLEEFIDISLNQFVKIYSFLENCNIPTLKNFQFYNCYITKNETFNELLTRKDKNRVTDEIRKFKQISSKLITDPFWDNDLRHSIDEEYIWNDSVVTNTSLAESFARNSSLISFIPSNFKIDFLEITNNLNKKEIPNFYNKFNLIQHLYSNQKIKFYQFCQHIFKESKLCFDEINIMNSFDLITKSDDENEFYNSFKIFQEMSWTDIIAQGGKGKNKAGLAFEKYHDQDRFRKYNISQDIYKFRCSQKYRAFGYRIGDVFYLLEFDLSHKLSN
jgi:hypothetical protein